MELTAVLSQIQGLIESKKFDELEALSWDFIDAFPQSIELFMHLAQAAMANDNMAKAEVYLLNASSIDTNNIDVLFSLAKINTSWQNYNTASGYLERILTIDAENIAAKVALGDVAYQNEGYAKASFIYKNLLSSGIEDKLDELTYSSVVYKAMSSLYINSQVEEAFNIIEQYAPKSFNEMVSLASLKIYRAMGTEKQAVIRTTLEQLHQHCPEKGDYILELIAYVDEQGEAALLNSLYTKLFALELSSTTKEMALRKRSSYFMRTEQWSLALEDLSQLLEQDQDWTHYQNRAEVRIQLKDAKGAMADYKEAILLTNSENIDLFYERAQLLIKANAFDQAIKDLEKVLAKTSNTRLQADCYYQLGVIYTKQKDRSSAVKMLMRSELMGNKKARTFLVEKYADKLQQVRTKTMDKYQKIYQEAWGRNGESPILQQAFGKVWLPNMDKFFSTIEEEMNTLPGKLIRQLVEEASKDMFIITDQGILFKQGSFEPVEAFYKVVVESEHSILLEIQATKGGTTENMRLSFFEGNLLVAYPVGETEVSPKYFMPSDSLTDKQKERLHTKTVQVPYMDSIEDAIATIG